MTADDLTGPEFARRAGITYRRIHWWTQKGWLRPAERPHATSGYPRVYPTSEVTIAALMGVLTADGVEPAAAHRMARDLAESGQTRLAGIALHMPEAS